MKKVAVFGNAGGGKSALSRQLAEITRLPLHIVDIVQFRRGRYWSTEKDGGKVSHEEYLKIHGDILAQGEWIIDGYGSVASSWERFSAADTLVCNRFAAQSCSLRNRARASATIFVYCLCGFVSSQALTAAQHREIVQS
jgi:adenylate kinase family enzyme